MNNASLDEATYFCPVCRLTVDGFLEFNGRRGARCPHCLGMERHRFLAYLFDRLAPMISMAGAVLDIAPQPGLREQLVDLVGPRYVAIDLSNDSRHIDVFGDLTHLPFADHCFDIIICYHVLEHVPDDKTAMAEIWRVLSRRGLAIVQVPYRANRLTDEDSRASPDERRSRFGQADHVRFYGRDFPDRLRAAGLEAVRSRPQTFLDSTDEARYVVDTGDVWLCRPADRWASRRPQELADRTLIQHV